MSNIKSLLIIGFTLLVGLVHTVSAAVGAAPAVVALPHGGYAMGECAICLADEPKLLYAMHPAAESADHKHGMCLSCAFEYFYANPQRNDCPTCRTQLPEGRRAQLLIFAQAPRSDADYAFIAALQEPGHTGYADNVDAVRAAVEAGANIEVVNPLSGRSYVEQFAVFGGQMNVTEYLEDLRAARLAAANAH